MHKENEDAVFQLMHSEENEKIVLQCFACGYKITAGQQLYENLINLIKAQKN